MAEKEYTSNATFRTETLSPWWRGGVLTAMIVGFSVLIGMTVNAYQVAPPIPDTVVGPDGATIFTGDDIRSGQAVFLKYGPIENGTVWGHGAYLGPDFSAEYLHTLGLDVSAAIASRSYGKAPDTLAPAERLAVEAQVADLLKLNRYDPTTQTLTFRDVEAVSLASSNGPASFQI